MVGRHFYFHKTSLSLQGDLPEHGNLDRVQDGRARSVPRVPNLQDGDNQPLSLNREKIDLWNKVMGEKEEEEGGGGEEEKEANALEEEEQEEVATEELVEKGTVALSETTTHWLLSVAGT